MRELETTVSYLKFHINQRRLFENRNQGGAGAEGPDAKAEKPAEG